MGLFTSIFRSRDRPKNLSGGTSFFMGGSSSGKVVTERSAMQMTAVYACVRIMSEAIAGLPLHLYKYNSDGGKEKALDHPLYRLLHDEPNPEMTSFVFRETLMTHLLLWGNAYAQIIRNGKGEVIALYPLMPNRMRVERDRKGELLITIMSSLAQEEARSISENTAWGHRKRFADGKFSLAYSTFLGYDKGPDGELVINEEQAVIVRRIYDDYLAGLSPYTIAKRLTEDGIETPAHKTVWQASTVYSILKNEKYYGAAILQKCITTDFLSKKQIKNTGQLPQYYIANDHEAIIPPEKFKMVQDEMQRREDAGFKAQCVSIFSARIVCGDCGGFYGRKIWHAGSKYASWRWHCNNKFQKRKYCSTPTLKEESLKEAFLEVFNGLIKRRDKIEKNYNRCLDAITDTSKYEHQLEELNKGCAEVQQLIKSLLISHGKQSEDESISDMYAEYENRLDTLAKLKQELDMKIAACSAKRTQVNGFLRELKKHDQPLVEFDDLVWQAVIHHARVDNNNTITFVFRDGTEVTTPIKNGVKPYKKRKKEEPSDE